MNLFTKKTEESTDEAAQLQTISPEMVNSLPENIKQQWLNELANQIGLRLNVDRSETRTITEEQVPQVITIGTELDKEEELTHEIKTKQDKWGFWLDYHGTKGKIFNTEVPQMQFGHLGAILPGLRSHIYKYTYKIDEETGEIERDKETGKPLILKKTRIHLAVELSNLKARLNLAQDGYARGQQERVIIGGVGQVSPMSESTMDRAMELMFGGKKGK